MPGTPNKEQPGQFPSWRRYANNYRGVRATQRVRMVSSTGYPYTVTETYR
jgi:hypothetical protein